ncbi:hypothetical protein M422DRAFT_47745 [Sphaerobolus stellatus SS14]|uniref:Uncharacterized protein n=1 Tax=Sphaerobolus stellatus (strain SS14) TaxID=990650 RepID=A0A0C9UKM0_SPHS4|nr:hypothetical protein M422DRAFT_47745 [Sphaerobolus stellatus SS14]
MHVCEPQESKTDMYSPVFVSDDESSDDERLITIDLYPRNQGLHQPRVDCSTGSKASTDTSSEEEPKLAIYEDVWDELADPLSVVLLYILQNTVAEIAIAHHQDLSGLSLPESQTMEEFMANLNRIKPKIMVGDGRTLVPTISVSEDCPIHHNSTESTYTSNSMTNSTGQRSICNNDITNCSDLYENIGEVQSPNIREERTEHSQIPIRPVTSRKLSASHTILHSQIPVVNRIARRWIPEFPVGIMKGL